MPDQLVNPSKPATCSCCIALVIFILALASLGMAAAQSPGAAPSGTIDVHRLAERVDHHYNDLHTMQAEFTESYRGAGVVRTESGTLWLKRPGRMRWEYREPRQKLFLTDGKTAWFY